MGLIGINQVSSKERKPSTLEQIALGVKMATDILGATGKAYETFGPEADQKRAITDYYKAKTKETLADTSGGAGKLSDIDKQVLSSYGDYTLSHDKGSKDNAVSIYLPTSGKTLFASPKELPKEKTFDSESKLREQFRSDQSVKDFRTTHAAAKSIIDSFGSDDYERADPARDVNLLYNFIKMMDPGSTVREGEIQLTSSASPFVDQMLQQYKKVKEGGILPPALRKSLVEQTAENYVSRAKDFQGVVGFYKDVSDANGVNWNRVITPLQELDLTKFKKSIAAPTAGLKIGDEVFGYKYLGGNPKDPKSWSQ